MSMKNPMTQSGIEPATFRFVAQDLNHCAKHFYYQTIFVVCSTVQNHQCVTMYPALVPELVPRICYFLCRLQKVTRKLWFTHRNEASKNRTTRHLTKINIWNVWVTSVARMKGSLMTDTFTIYVTSLLCVSQPSVPKRNVVSSTRSSLLPSNIRRSNTADKFFTKKK